MSRTSPRGGGDGPLRPPASLPPAAETRMRSKTELNSSRRSASANNISASAARATSKGARVSACSTSAPSGDAGLRIWAFDPSSSTAKICISPGEIYPRTKCRFGRECQLRLPGRPLGLLRLNCVAFCSPAHARLIYKTRSTGSAFRIASTSARCADLPRTIGPPDRLAVPPHRASARSSAMFNASTFTRGSPEEAEERPSMC